MSSLTFILLLPAITALGIAFVPARYRFVIRCLALLGSLETAIWAMVLFFRFEPGSAAIQFESAATWIQAGGLTIRHHVGLDGLNAAMFFVTALVGFAAVAVSWNVERDAKLFYILLLVMITGALGVFATWDLFFFYFFNELALVPTFLMIGIWGHGEKRTYQAFQMAIYLTLGALVALVGLIGISVHSGTGSFDIVELRKAFAATPLPATAQAWIFPCLLFGFGTLVGLWPFHSWAPGGYGCAPAAAAMMHAGILKKAGLYALLRVALPWMPDAVAVWVPVLGWLCLGNLLYCGWVAMRQRDLNLLLGNSSLAHMGFAFLGIASVSVVGVMGTVLVMVGHALLAALGFALSGWIRTHAGTLDMDRMGGLLKSMPFVGSVMILCFMAGCGVPGFASFPGEVSVLFGAWKSASSVSRVLVVAAAWGGLVIGAVYLLRAIRTVLHGEPNPTADGVRDLPDARDGWRRFPYLVLAGFMVLFGFAPSLVTRRAQPVVQEIVQSAASKLKATGTGAKASAIATVAKPSVQH